jgi:hypothetical protein
VQDVLRALEHYAPEFQQWSEWRSRPQCRFGLDFPKAEKLHLPHLSIFMDAEKLFALRMRAHLALHDSSAAFADFQDGLQAFRALHDEPSMICGLTRIAVLSMLLAGVGNGCQDHAWTEEDCRKIEAELARIRLWDDWSFTLASERCYFNAQLEALLRASRRERGKMFSPEIDLGFQMPSKIEGWIAGLYPRGMIRDSQYRQNRYFDELLARVDPEKQTMHLDRATPSEMGAPADRFEALHYTLILQSQGIYRELERRYLMLQTMVDQTRLACALERFYAKQGTYPAGLSELAPDFIRAVPTDIYAVGSYHYRRLDEKTFRLYGIGENRQDDGGTIAPGVRESKQLDAVWPYAPAR